MSKGAIAFKFAKSIISVLAATSLLGFVVPKINHAITFSDLNKKNKTKNPHYNLNSFIKDASEANNAYVSNSPTNFKGMEGFANALARASFNLENNNTWRLISTDTGMIAGRVKNSRTKSEGFGYAFRDTASIYFYNFAAANVVWAANKYIFKTPDIHPKALADTTNFLLQKLDGKKMSGKDLIKALEKNTEGTVFDKIKFDSNDTIKVRELLEQYDKLGINKKTDRKLIQNTLKMSHLQPKLRGERVLSKKQLQDVFAGSFTSDADFLKNAINNATYGRALNPKDYVSAKHAQSIRESIDDYCRYIAKKAGDNVIDEQFIKNMHKQTLLRASILQGAGFLFTIWGLALFVPKAQTYLTEKFFGKQNFEDIVQGKESDKKTAVTPS